MNDRIFLLKYFNPYGSYFYFNSFPAENSDISVFGFWVLAFFDDFLNFV